MLRSEVARYFELQKEIGAPPLTEKNKDKVEQSVLTWFYVMMSSAGLPIMGLGHRLGTIQWSHLLALMPDPFPSQHNESTQEEETADP